ncbi:glycosyltransferase [Catenulispora sp. NF23]|uniref:Glycosyltransferase n=1 Tax=Catenulispora pinistramenti TaxID=2705254 RepID=A0ABS5KLH0_9ACTN|nr:glycosyltransferase [Catenulispora pinistramenti]MBS2532092.1 glycosyltransferase [Catenulispora pinistramenti]MBS2546865.1 glycosyltransferase [Catenulispora pinistramenti]
MSPDRSSIDVSIITGGHDVADARLHRLAAALRRAGLGVEVVGLGVPEAGPADCAVRTLGSRSAKKRLKADLTLPFKARGKVLLTVDPDMVPGATLARWFKGKRLIADVHEDYLKLLKDRAWARAPWKKSAATFAVRFCTFWTKRANITVVADDHVPPMKGRKRLVVKNLPDFSFLPAPGEPDRVAPRAIYIGDVRRSRGLQAMLAAVEGTYTWELDVVGPVQPGDQAWLDQWHATSSEQVRNRIRFHGRLDPQKAWALADGAWAGLVLLDDTPAFREAVPSKLYEYLAVGLAVVATPLPRMAELVQASGAGEVVADPAAASATLRRWSEDYGELERARRNARKWAAEHLTGASPYDKLAEEIRGLVKH